MISRARILFGALVASAFISACSDVSSPTSPTVGARFQGGSSTGGGSTGGGKSGGGSTTVPTDNPVTTPGSTVSGPPVAPTYTARITEIGQVPLGMYYGAPSTWTVGGYVFQSIGLASFKAVNGPFVVGACVSVSFYEQAGTYIFTELKTLQSSKCS